MTSTELGTVVGERKPLARQALFLLATGVSRTLTGLEWLPSPGGSALDERAWMWTAIAAFIVLLVLLGRKWTKQQVQTSGAGTRKAVLGAGWITWLVVLRAVLLAGAAWLGRGSMFSGVSAGLVMIPLAIWMLFPKLIGGGRLLQRVSIHPDRIEVQHRDRVSAIPWRAVASAKAFEQVNPLAKLDPNVHGRMSKWFQKQPMLTLVLEGRSGEVVSISLGAFRNQNEMLDAIRGRLQAAGGPPVEVVPA